MITGPRTAVLTALESLPGLRVAWAGDPTVDVPTAFVAVESAEPDPTHCAHVTTVTVLVICQFDDPQKAGPALDAAADDIITALDPAVGAFTSATYGVYRDTAPSTLLSFQTRQ